MTATVHPFRQKPVKGLVAPVIPSNATRYCCTTCDSDVFRLLSDGSVYCAATACRRFITNIKVTK